uniref:Uncharacterized protein LOC117347421 isoform X2 n=1 Tax=Geotrypetes seraphini TaxID=260995 RepID=A0A6P8NZK0_GEOSA|nr:uncharacterized protein LOC117347421 isoform X2 [Geotrypetes seraphini]
MEMFSNTTDGQERRKQFILGIISATASLMFIGSIILISIGYLNSYSSLGVGILASGAVLYFAGIVVLGVSCMWVNNTYSGNMWQPIGGRARRSTEEASVSFINSSINRVYLRSIHASLSSAVLSDKKKRIQPDHEKDPLSSSKALEIGDFTTRLSTTITSNENAGSDQELDQQHQDSSCDNP